MNNYLIRNFYLLTGLLFYSAVQLNAQHIAGVYNEISDLPHQDNKYTLQEVLIKLESKYEIIFDYDTQLMKEKKVDLQVVDNLVEETDIEQMLKSLLEPLDLTFERYSDNSFLIYSSLQPLEQIRIKKKKPSESNAETIEFIEKLSSRMFVEQHVQQTIAGKVTDGESGEPLPGVNVLAKGTTIGTVTDVEGNYRLTVSDDVTTLIFSSIGYLTAEIPINSQNTINLALMPDVQSLSEVVVVGYGSARKQDVTGAITRVDVTQKALQPNVNPVQALRGAVAGVNVTDNGRPGSDATIIIRGRTSISAGNEPLIVLDGVPYAGSLSDINTNDIASIDILKDASSAAIYGARAANGVILITTKRGKSDKPALNYNGYYGRSDYAHTLDMMEPEQYLQLKEDASDFLGQDITGLNTLEEINFQEGQTIDPFEEIKRVAPMMNHELSISGQTDKVQYYLSGSLTDQKSPLRGDNFNRLSARLNLDIAVTDWLNIGTNSSYSIVDQSGIPANIGYASYLSPYSELYYEDGVPRPLPMNDGLAPNPLGATLLNEHEDITNNLFSNVYAEVQLPLPGLTYLIRAANTVRRRKIFNYTPSFNRDGFFNLGSGSRDHREFTDLIVENVVKYNQTFAQIHNVDVTLLYGFQNTDDIGSVLSSNNIFNDALTFHGLSIGENQTINTSAVESKAISSMARVGYRLMNRYIVNFTVRRDGYSAFGEGRKYGTFPSFGASWNISQEDFMSNLKWVDVLKLRYSIGRNGNRAIDAYSSLSVLDDTNYKYVFGDGASTSIGLSPTAMANPFLGWETTTASNFGIDFGIFRSRISGSVEYYEMKTSDLLLDVRIPNITGYERFLSNVGETENRGIEITLNTINVQKNNFSWSTDFVFTHNNNKVTKLSGADIDEDGVEDDDIASGLFIGEPLFSHYDYVYDGIWQEGEDASIDPSAQPGFIRFKDVDGNGSIGPEDRQVLFTSQPDFTYGFTSTLTYKGLGFSFILSGRKGGYSANSLLNHGTNFFDRVNVIDLPYWTPENPLDNRPSVGYPNPLGYGFYESRDFLRLQDITLSYNLPADIFSKFNVNNLRVYVSGKNVATWTQWHGWDPEHGSGGRFPANGPLIKSWIVGLNLSL